MLTLKKRNLIVVIIAAMLAGSLVSGSVYAVYSLMTDRMDISSKEYRDYVRLKSEYRKLDYLKNMIETKYYLPVENEDLNEGIYRGLFWGIGDPYSAYLTDKEYEDLMISANGKYEGIGVTIAPDEDGFINVVSPMDGSPAAKAGIKAGDKITAVNGVAYNAKTIDAAVSVMRGKGGTKVKVTVLQDGKSKDYDLIRSKIILVTVKTGILEDDMGYIRISSFEKNTADDFSKAVKDMELRGMKGLIIDLRDNSGGLVDASVDVADQLLSEGVVTYTEDRQGERTYFNSKPGKTLLPYVLLVNGGSASASEIVAGAVKDHGEADIVGVTTYGKGIIQEIMPLDSGGAVKLTVMQYFSPRGNVIHKKGVTPNYVVEYEEKGISDDIPDPEKDTQVQKAVELLKTQTL